MANPVSVTCTADTWVKVATNVTSGNIGKQSNLPDKYVRTYKLTGEAAPTDDDEAGPIFTCCDSATIGHSVAIDVYIKAIGAAGAVVVEL